MNLIRQKIYGDINPYENLQLLEKEEQGWASDSPVFEEVIKQIQPKVIVEVGAGPRGSILLTEGNFKRGIVVEPLIDRWPAEIREDYEKIGVEIIAAPYEDLEIDEQIDETWFFNVVQHVLDPKEQLEIAKKTSKVVRVFESIGSVTDTAHPHFITEQTFTDVLGDFGSIYEGGSEPGFHGADCYYGTWYASDNV